MSDDDTIVECDGDDNLVSLPAPKPGGPSVPVGPTCDAPPFDLECDSDDADTIARLTAERDEARRERDQLLDLVVVFDTPEYVCDGNIALTIRAAIDAFGIKCLDWVTAQDLLDDLRDSREQNDRLWRERDAARAECEAWTQWFDLDDNDKPGKREAFWSLGRAIEAHDAAYPGWRKEEGK